jgi:hypothetical protein
MHRREYIAARAAGLAITAGCFGGSDGDATTTETRTRSETPTATPETTEQPDRTSSEAGRTIYVGPNGGVGAEGTETDPLGSIQTAVDRAQPGDTVHVLPGSYSEAVRTKRSGTPDEPITVTGPPDAVFRGSPTPSEHKFGFHIEHSHIHVRGMTFNGLHDPANQDQPESYVTSLIVARHTPSSPDHYHQNLVIKPDAVGNTLRPLIHVMHSEGVEIGEFEVIGPPGLAIGKFGDKDAHNGEIVYLGTAPAEIPQRSETSDASHDFLYEPDTTNDVHIHHIDNSAGHPHAELVDVKAGCHDVRIEYCTDGGNAGSYIEPFRDQTVGRSITLDGRNVTVRWNRITGSEGRGIDVGNWGLTSPEQYERIAGHPYPESLRDHGRANSIYGNEITECAGLAIRYPMVDSDDGEPRIAEKWGPEAQSRVCGNTVSGDTHGRPGTECGTDVPTTETIGHLGGDSPWSSEG